MIFQLEQQIQKQEVKESGWRFDENKSRLFCFYKTYEKNVSSYVMFPLRSSTILKNENDDEYCFFWSILASLWPCNKNQPNWVSNYSQYFDELDFPGFDFSDGFRCSDSYIFEDSNNCSTNIIEFCFYQDE